MPAILVVDDLPVYLLAHETVLHGCGLEVVTASTLVELDEQYERHRDQLVAIILDGCVPGDELNTLDFIERTAADRKEGTFTGILMAASSCSDYRRSMVTAGCTHEAPKFQAAERVLELLTTQ